MAAASALGLKSDDEHTAPIATTNGADKGPTDDGGGMEQYYMSGPKVGVLLTGLCIALYLLGLDTSIVATAIPRITERFDSTTDIGWYGSAYFVALCSLLPLAGKLYSEFSLKWTFLGYFATFELGSLLCAVAVSSKMLIVSRAVAGAGGSGIISGIMTIIAHIMPLQQRAGYMALGGAVFGISTITGPLIGGALTQNVTWRWCFYINLPIGALTTIALIAFFHPPVRPNEQQPILTRLKKLDLVGAFLFIPSIVMVLLALQWGGGQYAWKSATIIGLFCGFGATLLVFIAWQLKMGSKAMIPLELLTRRTVVSASLTSSFVFGSVFIVVYYIPEWFQAVKGASPIGSGIRNIALFVPQILGSIIAGTMINKLGWTNPWIIVGTVFATVATGLYSTFEVNTGHAAWIGYQVLNGLGAGFSMETPLTAAQTVLKPAEIPVGISLVTFFQFFGPSIFLAIAQAVFKNKLLTELAHHAPHVNSRELLQQGTSAVRSFVDPADLPAVLFAYNKAITNTFYVAASAAACGFIANLFMEWNNVIDKGAAETKAEKSEEVDSKEV